MIGWLFLLLPLAAASGWWLAERRYRRRTSPGGDDQGSGMALIRGLNYLLDEQPDKALDVFLKLAEVDEATVETQLALGSLFRRRGEVDRAIRIHRALITRPHLDDEQRGFALYELGQDYTRAGLLDRAEALFDELATLQPHRERALRSLRTIYQQESDWARCLETTRLLAVTTSESFAVEIAQYHCELAERAIEAGERDRARDHLVQARQTDRHCVRATILEAQMAIGCGAFDDALELYRRVGEEGPEFIPAILSDLVDGFDRCGRGDLAGELHKLYRLCPSPRLVATLVERIELEQGVQAAVDFLIDHLDDYADLAGLERLLTLQEPQRHGQNECRVYRAALGVVRQLRGREPACRCEHCGFAATHLHWLCPSCKAWGSIKPTHPEPIVDQSSWSCRQVRDSLPGGVTVL